MDSLTGCCPLTNMPAPTARHCQKPYIFINLDIIINSKFATYATWPNGNLDIIDNYNNLEGPHIHKAIVKIRSSDHTYFYKINIK